MSALGEWLQGHELALWTIAVGALSAVPCAILGCYLVLRRMSLLGDAISHAVLPGLALAFLLTGSLSGWQMALGAGVLGVLTAYLTQAVHQAADVPEDAGMGVVFTSLFAVGVLLITRAAAGTDLDPGCVLYGLIEFTPLDTVPVLGLEVPRAVLTLGPTLLVTVGFVALFWKELKVVAFDPALAAAMGVRVALVHYLLMAMVAAVTVTSFEAVGSILVIAMLIVPAAAAHLLSDRLAGMVVWAAGLAALSAVLGYAGGAHLNTSVAGMMAVASGGLFALAVVFAPRHGILSQAMRRFGLALRIAREDLLAELYRAAEPQGPSEGQREAGARWVRWLAEAQLRRAGLIERQAGEWQLTASGRARAEELVRGHRLWETYLTSRLGLSADHVHEPADRIEHHLTPQLRERIVSELGDPNRDPHGRPIPPSGSP